jgi:hypothetical protein
MAPTFLGDFYLVGSELRKKGINRIGNLLIANDVRTNAWEPRTRLPPAHACAPPPHTLFRTTFSLRSL